MGIDRTSPSFEQGRPFEIAGAGKTCNTVNKGITRAALMEWLVLHVAEILEMPPDSIDISRNLEDDGLDSLQAVGLAGDLQSWLGIEIPPTVIWDYASIEAVCDFLSQLIATAQSPTDEASGKGPDTCRKA